MERLPDGEGKTMTPRERYEAAREAANSSFRAFQRASSKQAYSAFADALREEDEALQAYRTQVFVERDVAGKDTKYHWSKGEES